MTDHKIQRFQDLQVWNVAHHFVIAVYKSTEQFPQKEVFGLTSQIRRAVVSITSNIAEGFSRYSYSDRLRFYYMSRGSLSEVQNQLLISKELFYLQAEQFDTLWEASERVSALLNAFIRSTQQLVKS